MNNPFEQTDRHQVWWVVLGCLSVVLLFGLGFYLDGEPVSTQATELSDFEHGRQVGRAELRDTVRDAYVQGQRDAVSAVNSSHAQGLQLAQTCMAWWYDAPIDKATLRKRVCGAKP